MVVHIKLYSGKRERFEEIKEQVAEDFGYEPTNPEVIGVLMAAGTETPPGATR